MTEIINNINGFLWGWFMLLILTGTHIFMTLRTGVIQRRIFKAIRLSVRRENAARGGISPFASLMTALASTIGTGNIIGVGTAIALGGPGAVLWCWLTGIFGIATKYAESLIAVKHRVYTADGRVLGGAMYVLENRLGLKKLGALFAVFTIFASFGIGSGVQINAIASIFEQSFGAGNLRLFGFGVPIIPLLTGLVAAAVTAAVIFGGIKSVSKVCRLLVPLMAGLYVLGCLIILFINRAHILGALSLIIRSAFAPSAAGGGFAGSSVMLAARFGIARGLFSNESGLGSAPIVASAARCRNPARQALISATGTFWDTVVVCMITGLTIVSSMLARPDSFAGADGESLSFIAFSALPYIGAPILTVGIAAFAYSTILGWSYYGESCAEYLFGARGKIPYRLVFVFVVFIGAVVPLGSLWSLSDIFNALMALPNLTAVLMLSGEIARDTERLVYGQSEKVGAKC